METIKSIVNLVSETREMGKFRVIVFVIALISAITIDFVCSSAHLGNCSVSEFEALIDFKSGLNDPEDRLSSWNISHSCCEWRGISCDYSTGSVIAVDLHNPHPLGLDSDSPPRYGFWNLSGEIRPSLLKLRSLRYLDLSFNTFEDIKIPKFFGSFKNLLYLNLSTAGFSGIVPPKLGNLSNLEYLDVSRSVVDDLQWVTGLVSLKHLQMTGVDLSYVGSTWFDVFNMLPYLSELHLSFCGLSGSISSERFVNFTSLSVIDLSFNSFNSRFPDWLVNVSSLEYVDLSSSELQGRIPLGLGELPSLRYLSLAGNNLSAGCHKFFKGSWKKIEYLDLAINKLHGKLPASIGNMTSLTYINLFANNIEGGIPDSIGGLCNLVFLSLDLNDLSGSLPEILRGTERCVAKSPLPSLLYLDFAFNRLVGNLPEWLSQLQNLVVLELSYNMLEGPIPASLGTLQQLGSIGLVGNKLNGTLPLSFGQLSNLSFLDVSFNNLEGSLNEAHFSELSQLKIVHLSSNSFVLNVSSNWIPPFFIRFLDMGSCQLGPSFPSWLEHQKELMYLDISNASISGSIPSWFWDISSNLSLLNISHNHLKGQIPSPLSVLPYADVDLSSNLFEGSFPLPSTPVELLDLSNNFFSGPLPRNISEYMPDLIFLSLSNNQLTGQVPDSLGQMLLLTVIDLSRNNLIGGIPSSIGNCSYLKVLDLGNNNLSGRIPSSLGQLNKLQSLHLNDNNFLGELPPSFYNLTSLETFDLGNNRLSGKIAPWLGESFTNLRIIKLQHNAFFGELPTQLFSSRSLQVIDISGNNLTGKIPANIRDLRAMAQVQQRNEYLLYGSYRGRYYEESLVVIIKGQSQEFTKTLSLMISIDLSGNSLSGKLPEEITKLHGLVVLNLSRNHISGPIPGNIESLRQLSSLDVSNNYFSGTIPPTMPLLTFLSYLNLSNNNLWGEIPYSGQMTTYDGSSFAGNPGLCGPPLAVSCPGEDPGHGNHDGESDDSDDFVDIWFYVSIGSGFVAGVLVPFMIVAIRKPWSAAYFSFIDKVVNRLVGENRSVGSRKRKHHV